jgi:cyclic pyranopterin phosphate synthase
MPAELYGENYEFHGRHELLTFEEIERLARIFVDLGVEKLRITGGEPLLRHQLPDLIERLSAIPNLRDLALTTNGYLLAKQASALEKAGLRRVTVSLDSLNEDVFKHMSGSQFSPERVLEGIESASRVGLRPVKINCMVERGVNTHTIVDLARRFHGTEHIVRFIEFMDVGTLNGWKLSDVMTAAEIAEIIHADLPIEAIDPNYPGEVAHRYRYLDGGGEIGIISSVSAPFCGDCNRARLTIEGKLVTCLFAEGGTDLRAPLRSGASDSDLRELIESVWSVRTDRYSEERGALIESGEPNAHKKKIEMYQIGG